MLDFVFFGRKFFNPISLFKPYIVVGQGGHSKKLYRKAIRECDVIANDYNKKSLHEHSGGFSSKLKYEKVAVKRRLRWDFAKTGVFL